MSSVYQFKKKRRKKEGRKGGREGRREEEKKEESWKGYINTRQTRLRWKYY